MQSQLQQTASKKEQPGNAAAAQPEPLEVPSTHATVSSMTFVHLAGSERPASKADVPVRVKNSYNPAAEGTLITADWTQKGLVSAITAKSSIVVVDITSTRMLGAYGFLAMVFDSFKRHHYLTEGINKSCWSWELRLHGRPIGFHSVNAALGMPGAGEGTSGGSREHRVVILPDFQGIGLGWMLAETVAAQLTSTGRRYTSITMHPTFGACRDRSERWRPNARNHKADKDEATTDVRGRSLAQKAGTWAPTTRDKLRPSYRHEYVGDPCAERETILANLSDTTPPHNCKPVGCAHCTTNRAEFQKNEAPPVNKAALASPHHLFPLDWSLVMT